MKGAQPRQWFDSKSPFFKPSDPMNHITEQAKQFHDAVKGPFRVSQREREPEWKLGRRYDVGDVRAKRSEIRDNEIIEKNQEILENRNAKDVNTRLSRSSMLEIFALMISKGQRLGPSTPSPSKIGERHRITKTTHMIKVTMEQ